MRYVIGMLEGHWLACFVSVTYSPHHFRWSFVLTTWYPSVFPRAVRREDHVCRSRGS
jgi:hypothetical protein